MSSALFFRIQISFYISVTPDSVFTFKKMTLNFRYEKVFIADMYVYILNWSCGNGRRLG